MIICKTHLHINVSCTPIIETKPTKIMSYDVRFFDLSLRLGNGLYFSSIFVCWWEQVRNAEGLRPSLQCIIMMFHGSLHLFHSYWKYWSFVFYILIDYKFNGKFLKNFSLQCNIMICHYLTWHLGIHHTLDNGNNECRNAQCNFYKELKLLRNELEMLKQMLI